MVSDFSARIALDQKQSLIASGVSMKVPQTEKQKKETLIWGRCSSCLVTRLNCLAKVAKEAKAKTVVPTRDLPANCMVHLSFAPFESFARLSRHIAFQLAHPLDQPMQRNDTSRCHFWGRTGFDHEDAPEAACRGWFVGLVKNRTENQKLTKNWLSRPKRHDVLTAHLLG